MQEKLDTAAHCFAALPRRFLRRCPRARVLNKTLLFGVERGARRPLSVRHVPRSDRSHCRTSISVFPPLASVELQACTCGDSRRSLAGQHAHPACESETHLNPKPRVSRDMAGGAAGAAGALSRFEAENGVSNIDANALYSYDKTEQVHWR